MQKQRDQLRENNLPPLCNAGYKSNDNDNNNNSNT